MIRVTGISIAKAHGRQRGMPRRSRGVCAGLTALALALFAQSATAADLGNTLRGSFTSATASRWDGVNFGVHTGLSNLNADFSNSVTKLLEDLLNHDSIEVEDNVSSWPLMSTQATNSRTYGAFLGYNVQWDELVLGFDVAYNRLSSMQTSAAGANGWIIHTTNGYDNFYTVSGDASIKLIDYGVLRARAGYAFGQFLPYAAVGAAVGRFNYTRSVTVTLSGIDVSGAGGTPYDFGTQSRSDSKDNAVVGGVAAGLGMDVALLPNVFLRGEWEVIAFAPVGGTKPILNTGRVGLGVKF
jgi:hypothetical protein